MSNAYLTRFRTYRLFLVVLLLAVTVIGLLARTPAATAAVSPGIPTMGQTIWPIGVNYAWHDFGNDFTDNNWATRFTNMKAHYDDMAAKGVKISRWWIFAGLAHGSPIWSGQGRGSLATGLPAGYVQNMVAMTNYAYSKGIRIYYTFVSFDIAATYNGAIQHDDIVDNVTVRNSFFENAVKPIVQGLGSNPGVFGWDIINEPEWIINAADGGNPGSVTRSFSLAQMRTFVGAFVNYIRPYVQQPISVGSASMKWIGAQYNFWSGLGLDFYDFHWYDWATPYFNPTTQDASLLNLDKPIIIGEVMPNIKASSVGKSHQEVLELVLQHGYAGYLTWAWTDANFDTKPYIAPDFANFRAAHPELNFGSSVPPTPGPSPTATRTSTRTNTPVVTATVPTVVVPTNTQPPSGSLTVQIRGGGSDNNQQTAFNVAVRNNSSSAVSGLSVRVYFTLDGSNPASNYTLEKYYDQSGVATFSAPTLACGSTYYIAVNYGTASLGANQQWELQTALHLANWGTNYSGANDHFHTGFAVGALPTSYTNHNYLPGYINGTLAWGTTPACGGTTPTTVPTTAVPPTTVSPSRTPTRTNTSGVTPTRTATRTSTRTNTPTTPTRVPTTAIAPTATLLPCALPCADVTISGMAFTPADVAAVLGQRVRWVNRDTVAHTVTSDDGTSFNATLQPGQSFVWTVTGNVNYHCNFHPTMTGRIIVEGPPPPTFTRTPTRLPTTAVPTTPAPTVPVGGLKVQYKAADTATGDNQLKPHFRIVNTGTTAVALSTLKIRYYFTKDNTAGLNFTCDWAQVGCGNLSGAFVAATGTNTDTYLEISFTAGAGSVAAGGNTGDIQARINHSDWTNFNEANDYSFDATKINFADWNRVTLYQNGTLVWGTTP